MGFRVPGFRFRDLRFRGFGLIMKSVQDLRMNLPGPHKRPRQSLHPSPRTLNLIDPLKEPPKNPLKGPLKPPKPQTLRTRRWLDRLLRIGPRLLASEYLGPIVPLNDSFKDSFRVSIRDLWGFRVY